MIQFSLVRDFVLYIFFLLAVVSIFRVQSRGPIRSCNNNITMTTHSLNVRRELCASRSSCVSMATTRADRFVNGICLSANVHFGVLQTRQKTLIPKIANLREWTD